MRFRLFGTAPSKNPTLIDTDGMRDDALVLADKELEGDAAHELTAYEYPSGDKKDWNFVILTWEK